jgi:hypothetical protein
MKLPNYDKAKISSEKITDYLLSETHPVGRAKAHYFRSLGYSENNIAEFSAGLLQIVCENDIAETIGTGFGTKYLVKGNLRTPHDILVEVITIWIIEKESGAPRFVTAYPA